MVKDTQAWNNWEFFAKNKLLALLEKNFDSFLSIFASILILDNFRFDAEPPGSYLKKLYKCSF
jgi:hypothetical protein